MFLVRRKVGKIIVIILLAVLLKGTILLETAIDYLPHCEVLERFVPVLANQLDGLAAVRYWGRKISTVIVPFFILIYCNCRIVMELRNKQKEMQQKSIKKRSAKSDVTSSSIRQHYREKRGVRTATKTLVLVVGCYLLSNLVSILLGFWDHLAPRDVERNYYGFLIVSDLASLIRQNQLDKWSIVVVSNSLRSNLTGMNNLYASQDWLVERSKRARDELAYLLQNRRKILVDMTFRLAIDKKMAHDHRTNEEWLTDIQEEDSLQEKRRSRFQSVLAENSADCTK